ncbi:MAG: hypothetical protein H6728_04910 [Myxococcales bacterium]|nr:hypothetical protein [Myxococcales bacterium]MCB9642393.1 hypothetical protein [Myxococcales bacterium]
MKTKRLGWSLLAGLGLWGMMLQTGCGMETTQQPAESAKSGLLGDNLIKGAPVVSAKIKANPHVQVLANQVSPVRRLNLQDLRPIGVWNGSLKLVADGSQIPMTMDLRLNEKASLVPTRTRRVREAKPSWIWSLLGGTAHACGPYGQEVRVAALASWSVKGTEFEGNIGGDIVTYDNFQYSAGINFKDAKGTLLTGSAYIDYKTKKLMLSGSVLREGKTATGQLTYKNIGSYTLERTDSIPLSK